MHFPSILYLIEQQRSVGAEVSVVPSADGVRVDTRAADRRHRRPDGDREHLARAVQVGLCPGRRGDRGAGAEVGAVTVIDGYQSVGTIPVDVQALGVDVYIGGCLKWLCGGPERRSSGSIPDLPVGSARG